MNDDFNTAAAVSWGCMGDKEHGPGPQHHPGGWGGFSKEAVRDVRTNWFNERRGAHFKSRHEQVERLGGRICWSGKKTLPK